MTKTITLPKSELEKILEELETLRKRVSSLLKKKTRKSLELTDYAKKMLAKSEEDRKAGRVLSFKSIDEAIEYNKKLIKDDRERNKNQVFK